MKNKSSSGRRLTIEIAVVIILLICLSVTSIALIYAVVSVDNHLFHTGKIKINLNDGEPVIREHEFLFEPGMTVEKEFFIQNQSTWDVYYRLYFDKVEGGLADYLEITILDGDRVLYKNSAVNMKRDYTVAADDILRINETRNLTIRFHFPEESGNAAQNLTLSFELCADAVQTKNNPNKLFH